MSNVCEERERYVYREVILIEAKNGWFGVDEDGVDDLERQDGLDVGERIVTGKCYSKIETSSSAQQIKKLLK